jgi:hypothetical protein
MRKVDPSEMKEKQTASEQELNEKLNTPFIIELSILPAKEAPGPVWLDQYDPEYLQVMKSGYFNDYEGNQSFWVEFNPIKAGQTQVGFVQQPRLINPLYINYPYTVNIS